MDNKFNNILVGFDNSKSAQVALKKAVDTARRTDAKVHALYVTDDETKSTKTIQEYIDELHTKSNVKINFIRVKGKAYAEILAKANEIDADLIIVGSHSTGGWQPFWAGKNAFRVISASNCPVITVQEHTQDHSLENILLPMDTSDTTRQKVPYAAMMAKIFNAKVHILGVSKNKKSKKTSNLKTYISQTAKYFKEHGVSYETSLNFGGNVVKKIIKNANKKHAGLIVIMSDTESRGLILGNYSQELINTSDRPVMSIHSRDLKMVGKASY